MGCCGIGYYVTLDIMALGIVTMGFLALGVLELGNMALGIMTCNRWCQNKIPQVKMFTVNYLERKNILEKFKTIFL